MRSIRTAVTAVTAVVVAVMAAACSSNAEPASEPMQQTTDPLVFQGYYNCPLWTGFEQATFYDCSGAPDRSKCHASRCFDSGGRFICAQAAGATTVAYCDVYGPIGIPNLEAPPNGAVLPADWTSIGLIWRPVANAAGYSVRVEDADTGDMIVAVDMHPTTQYNLFGIQSGHHYRFWVRAADSNFRLGDESTYSPPSAKFTFSVASQPATTQPTTPATPAKPATPSGESCTPNTIVGVDGKVMDASGFSSANGTLVELWDDLGQDNEKFTFQPDGTIHGFGGKCVDAAGISSADGTFVQLWDCWGGPNQQWSLRADGSIQGIGGKCIDSTGGSSAKGTALILNTCNGSASQRWRACSSRGVFE